MGQVSATNDRGGKCAGVSPGMHREMRCSLKPCLPKKKNKKKKKKPGGDSSEEDIYFVDVLNDDMQ